MTKALAHGDIIRGSRNVFRDLGQEIAVIVSVHPRRTLAPMELHP